MIGRIIRGLTALVAWFSIATTLAIGLGLAWFGMQGRLTTDNLTQIAAVLQGVDLISLRADLDEKRRQKSQAQVSLAEIARARALKMRDVELREQGLRTQIDVIRFEQAKLVDETDRYMQTRQAFEAKLATLREGILAAGEENARLILESIKPAQAKDQLVRMIDDGQMDQAVALVAAMPVTKRAKVVGEFKTPDEAAMLAELLRRVREGVPEIQALDEAQKQLDQLPPAGS